MQGNNQAIHIRTCEVCGKTFVEGYGYSLALCWLVTGSAFVQSFMCDQTEHNPQPDPNAPQHSGQHWGCSPEHAMQALEKCLKEHMHIDKLQAKHEKAHRVETREEDGTITISKRQRYSNDDRHWADEAYKKRGEDFHIVEVKL